jgi:hypothetical protein
MVRGLASYSDYQLLELFQANPLSARYFVGLFCRYSPLVETLLPEFKSSKTQILWQQYLWQHLHGWFLQVRLQPNEGLSLSLQEEIRHCLDEFSIPDEQSLSEGEAILSPVLNCYLMLGLTSLAPPLRFILVLHDRFHWSVPQISAQLEREGYASSVEEVQAKIEEARQLLFQAIPVDIRALYLTSRP